MKQLLIDKYTPKCIDDLILSPEQKTLFKNFVASGTIPNLLFHGKAGIAKTQTARALAMELGADVLFISASLDNNIEVIRTKVKEFANTLSVMGNIKIVILDEADALTANTANGAGAQDGLRNLIQDSSDDTRYILTCNYLERIIEALRSRCTPVSLQFDKQQLAYRVKYILDKEKIPYNVDTFTEFYINVIDKHYPDIRSVLNLLDHCTSGGQIDLSNVKSNTADISKFVNELVRMVKSPTNVYSIRKFYIQNSAEFMEDYEFLAQKLFDALDTEEADVKVGKAMIVIGEHLYRMSQVIDKELQFAAMIVRVQEILM